MSGALCVYVCERETEKCGCIWIGFVCEWVSLDYVHLDVFELGECIWVRCV